MADDQTGPYLEARLVAQALRDPSFRERLISDPKDAVAEFFSIELPENTRIRVIESEDGETVIVLPRIPDEVAASFRAAPAGQLEAGIMEKGSMAVYAHMLGNCTNTGTLLGETDG